MKAFCLFLVFLLVGCGGIRITNLEDYLPEKEVERIEFKTVDSSLQHIFLDEAYVAVQNIYVYDNTIHMPYAAGVNVWANILSFINGHGIGRKVIINEETLSIRILIHEYVHHLDDLTRDGKGSFIDVDEFDKAFSKMKKHGGYKNIIDHIEKGANDFWTNVFGVGASSEEMAYLSKFVWKKQVPQYMLDVYRNIFKVANE